MYQGKDHKTKCLFSDLFPLGGHLDPSNRWMKIEALIPWDELERRYTRHFSDRGRPAKDARLVLGLILLKHMTQLSDSGVVQSMLENPYQQSFCGYTQFTTTQVIHSSTLSRARKRLGTAFFKEMEEACYRILIEKKIIKPGGMLVDGTVINESITYPNDVGLLNKARERIVTIVKVIGKRIGKTFRTRPREARKKFLSFSKKKRKTARDIRKAKKSMLQYLKRNLEQAREAIEIARDKGVEVASWVVRQLLDAERLYDQQKEMYDQKSRRVDDRIVSLHKPYVRPIVRGKGGGKQVEFGPKIAVSHVGGFAFVDAFDYDNFSEATVLPDQVEAYEERFGKKPPYVAADKLYGNRHNRAKLQAEEIRSALSPLGRPSKVEGNERRWRIQKQRERNRIEGAFGCAKEYYGVDRIRYKGEEGGETWVRLGFLGMNLMTAMRRV